MSYVVIPRIWHMKQVQTYTWDGKDPENVSNVQKTNQRATNKTRKEGLKVMLT